jgi:hypothetical protein
MRLSPRYDCADPLLMLRSVREPQPTVLRAAHTQAESAEPTIAEEGGRSGRVAFRRGVQEVRAGAEADALGASSLSQPPSAFSTHPHPAAGRLGANHLRVHGRPALSAIPRQLVRRSARR